MAKIQRSGYYIHHSIKGYNKNGVFLDSSYEYNAWHSRHTEILNSLKLTKLNGQEKDFAKTLEQFLNAARDSQKDKNDTFNFPEDEKQKMYNLISEEVNEKYNNVKFDDNGNLISGGSNSSITVSQYRNKPGYLDLDAIRERLNKMNDLAKNSQDFLDSLQKKNKNIDTLNVKLKELNNKIANMTKNSGVVPISRKYGTFGFITQFNDVIREYYGQVPKALIEGLHFEYFVEETVKNFMDQLNTELKSTGVQVTGAINAGGTSRNINEHLVFSAQGSDKITIDTEYNMRSKVDSYLTITVNGKPKYLGLSEKSETFGQYGSWITLVSGTPLYRLLMDTDKNYQMHFTNIAALGPKAKNARALVNDAEIIMLARAIKGYDINKKLGDFLIVNDKTTGQIKVKLVDELLQDVIQKVEQNGNFKNLVTINVNGKNILINSSMRFLGKENRKIGRKGNDIELAYQRSKKVISGYLASRAVVNLRFLMN